MVYNNRDQSVMTVKNLRINKTYLNVFIPSVQHSCLLLWNPGWAMGNVEKSKLDCKNYIIFIFVKLQKYTD